ncbi:MAG TPA: hypothetical protein VMT03_25100 [Polyangia bacterium]|nr:hypothetical protein [Polyangia bacterium]
MSPVAPLAFSTAFLVILSGCDPTPIFKIENGPNAAGIPFFPLVAVNKETSVYEQQWTKVDLTVSSSLPIDAKTRKAATTTMTLFTCASGVALEPTDDAKISTLIGDVTTLKSVADIINKANAEHGFCRTFPGPVVGQFPTNAAEADKLVAGLVLVSRQIEVTQEVSTETKSLVVMAPSGGTANADIKLDPRGTLTEAAGQKQDQLPQTVASVIGTIGGAAVTAAGSAFAAHLIQPVPGLPKNDQEPGITVALSLTPMRRPYTVVVRWIPQSGTSLGDTISPCRDPKQAVAAQCHAAVTTGDVQAVTSGPAANKS